MIRMKVKCETLQKGTFPLTPPWCPGWAEAALNHVAAGQVTGWNLEVDGQLMQNTNENAAIPALRSHNRVETKEELISPDGDLYRKTENRGMGGDAESRLAALQPQASSSRSTVKSDINVVL